MIPRLLTACLGVVLSFGLVCRSLAQEPKSGTGGQPEATAEKESQPKPEKDGSAADSKGTTEPGKSKSDAREPGKSKGQTERATFGGGCFWCTEAVFERIPGVKSVVSGYAGGRVPYPTYEMVCSGLTGHAEVVQIEFDPDVVSYEKLLKVFFAAHDPTTPNMQADDVGTNYRSIILYHSEEQKQAALKYYKDLTARKVYHAPIVTELVPMNGFYPAEPYHQNYYRTHMFNDYSAIHITPKLKKLHLLPTRAKTKKTVKQSKSN